ncbi:hypothetical protein NQ317_006109 [Molorchus minor]|uniref:Uncharacterized protein n=1 Tax=Molorchus minor TaxID=1323400 RepID=A0ABQ9IZH9_9CUCU|nr:hypothetical protein NQ317_006109 [Molorchus minor]
MPKCDVKTRYIPATFAWTLLIVATTLFFYYPAQYYIPKHPWVPAYQGVITFFVLANFTLATFMDPGVIPKAPPDEDREDDFRAPLYKNVDINGHREIQGGYNPFSRGCWDNCCYAQFGPQYPSLMKPHKYNAKRKHCPHGPIATIANDSQVKTYMDNSNGVRNINSNAYNKMSPGRDGCELDMEPSASQSQDCEPTPPLQRHGSKSNFFLPTIEGESPRHPRGIHYPRSSPHPRPRGLDPNRSGTPENLGQQRPSPTMQQRIKALGVPTPLAMSSPVRRRAERDEVRFFKIPKALKNRGERLDALSKERRESWVRALKQGNFRILFLNNARICANHFVSDRHASVNAPVGGYIYLEPFLAELSFALCIASIVVACAIHRSNPSTPTQPRRPDFIGVVYSNQTGQYYEFQPQDSQPQRPMMSQGYGSPQRRFMSEGELVRQEAAQLSYPRSNNTVDNIRELANSPQRGVYMWKDTSPGPTQQQQQQLAYNPPRTYHPAMRGGVPVYPPQSPQVHRKAQIGAGTPTITVPDNRRRPMSFVRALEMSDNVELNSQNSQCSAHMSQRPLTPDRTSVYDMNYEISV